MTIRTRRLACVCAVLLAGAPSLHAQSRVGTVRFPNSGAPAAQPDFLFGVAQLHNFQYASAAAAFRRAQQTDPGFVLAYWGEAMTYNHAVWQEQDRAAARAVLERLGADPRARRARAGTEREGALLATLDILYGDGDKKTRDDAYARAMQALYATYPADLEIGAFTALAILGTAHEGRDFATYMRAAAILEELFDRAPEHPGVAHYLIHSYDDPIHAPLGLRAARVYSRIAPDASHAQHMTSHIFVASGMWEDVVRANLNALEAGRRARGVSESEAPGCGHPVTWLSYGYLQLGEAHKAAELVTGCHAAALAERNPAPVFDPDNSAHASFVHMWARYLIDTEDFDSDVARLRVELGPEQVQERMTVAFIDGLRAARSGATADVRHQLERIRALGDATVQLAGRSDLTYEPQAIGRSEVLALQMAALLAQTEGDVDAAVARAREACAREEQMPFLFGPPYVDKPSWELLGDILLAAGRRGEAATAYRAALARTPGRTQALRGLARAEA